MKVILNILFLLIFIPTNVFAVELTTKQKKDWAYLETLSRDAQESFLCMVIFGSEKQNVLLNKASTYHKKITDELAYEVDLYIENNSHLINKNETKNNFIYRIWWLVINFQKEILLEDLDIEECASNAISKY